MIKIVCARCGKVIREGAPGVKLVSHLICPGCFEKEMRRLDDQAQGRKACPACPPHYHKPSDS